MGKGSVYNPDKKGNTKIRPVKKELRDRMAALEKTIRDKEKKVGKKSEKKPKPKTEDLSQLLEDDKAFTYKMLADMRGAYSKAGGARKLSKLIKSDDKLLMAMVKELMKVEASLLATEIRNKEAGNGGKTVFVILKGLQTEADVIKEVEGELDMVQIADAVNPSAAPKIEYIGEEIKPENG